MLISGFRHTVFTELMQSSDSLVRMRMVHLCSNPILLSARNGEESAEFGDEATHVESIEGFDDSTLALVLGSVLPNPKAIFNREVLLVASSSY